jgi:hypothetical protein
MNCPFYGHHASRSTRTLITSGGNECALIVEAYSGCRMETAGKDPDLELCELNGSGRAADFASFTQVMFGQQADSRGYPD